MEKMEALLTPELEQAIARKYESTWNKGETGLDFYLVYLSVEVELFEIKGNYAWNLLNEGPVAERIQQLVQAEGRSLQHTLTQTYRIWNELNVQPRLVHAYEIHRNNLLYGDLIFVHLKLPDWVSSSQRYKVIHKTCSLLEHYRKNNPQAIIVAITNQLGFRLDNDAWFHRWLYDLSNVRPGAITALVKQLLDAPQVLQNYFYNQHTSDRLERLLQVYQMQEKVQRLQALQTDIRLLILIHVDLYDTYAEKIRAQLKPYGFKSMLLQRHTEFALRLLKEFNYFILFQCDFPEIPEAEQGALAQRVFQLDADLSMLEIQPTPRIYQLKNKLEERFLQLEQSMQDADQDMHLHSLKLKYQDYWQLVQTQKTLAKALERMEQQLLVYHQGYFALVCALLIDMTKKVAGIHHFEDIMKHFMHYLIVDDCSPALMEYLLAQGFPSDHVQYMSCLDLYDLFRLYKQQTGASGPEAYQQFLVQSEVFARFDIVYLNAWNTSEQGDLLVKFRVRIPETAPHKQRQPAAPTPPTIRLVSRSVNEFLSMGLTDLLAAQLKEIATGKIGEKHKVREDLRLKSLFAHMLALEHVAPLSKLMSVKKSKLYQNHEMEQRLQQLKQDILALSQEMNQGSAQDTTKTKPSSEQDWFAPLAQYNLKKLELLALGCGISQLRNLEHLQTGGFLVEEARHTGKSALEILRSVRVRIVSQAEGLAERSLRAVFPLPEPAGGRIHYRKTLPIQADFTGDEFLLLVILYTDYGFEPVVRCLQARNHSSMSHIPVVLVLPKNAKLEKYQESILETLIGLHVRETGDVEVFPFPYRIEALDNPQRVKHFFHEVLGITQLLEKPPAPDVPFEQTQPSA